MKLVSVVLDIPTQALDSTFTYVAIENENDRICFSKLVAQDLAQNQEKAEGRIDPSSEASLHEKSFGICAKHESEGAEAPCGV